MKKTIVVGLGAASIAAIAFAAKDPVIMTVNGVDVPKSEFEYLYNKNNSQQINPQNLDEYVEMFKLYKMKVEDAKAEGIDTTASFIKETEQYRHDLAAPYLADSTYLNKLVDESYARMKEEVEAKHIMLFKTRDQKKNAELRARMDSIHTALINGASFEELAQTLSQDRSSSSKSGRMGYITANQFPIAFEKAAYETPEGQISEVVESPQGYHILKGGKHRAARGKVQAAHILKLTQNLDAAGKAAAKQKIDSIYDIVSQHPEKFAEIASKNSDDRGSARQGGMLPVFGAGEMVEAFDSVAFSLNDGEISKPFESQFGWHIIHKISHKDIATRDQVKPSVLSRIANPNDDRYKEVRKRQTASFEKKHKGSLNQKTLTNLRGSLSVAGLDSVYFAKWTAAPQSSAVLATVDGKNYTAGEFAESIKTLRQSDADVALNILNDNLDSWYNGILVSAEEASLDNTVPEYHNLLKEYVDGSLLYEVSVRKVWDKAAKDTEGLEKYFNLHKSEYAWNEPHVKGYLVQATNDSVGDAIRLRASQLGADTLVNTIRKEFKKQAVIDRVLVAKGSNAMVDNLMFGGPKVEPAQANYQVYFLINPRLISTPEEVADVKGQVTSDYQNEFQAAWENELRKKYPVTVNEKVLKQVKSSNK
jgi:peptidyl-prolyl cis-trans isomerase SurA